MAESFVLKVQIRRARADVENDPDEVKLLDHRERARLVQSLATTLGIEAANSKDLDTSDHHEEAWVELIVRGYENLKEALPYISSAVTIFGLWKKTKRAARISVTAPNGVKIDIEDGDPDMVAKILKEFGVAAA
jgi:hypothetical protein